MALKKRVTYKKKGARGSCRNRRRDYARRRVALPSGFVSQAGDNLRSSLSDMQFTQRAARYPCKYQYRYTEDEQAQKE